MHLKSHVFIACTSQEVWEFLGNPANVSKWDRGVAGVEETSSIPHGAGFEFDTIAHAKFDLPDQGRMSYRIKEVDAAAARCVVELTSTTGNARFFKSASWHFQVQPTVGGIWLTCVAVFDVHRRYFFLPLLLSLKKNAISMDLNFLKQAIESR
jgi:hypothetical protein